MLSGVGWCWWAIACASSSIKGRNRSLEIEVARRTAQLRAEVEQRLHVEEELHQHKMAEAVAAERSRLARELHDAVTQTLFSYEHDLPSAARDLGERTSREGRRARARAAAVEPGPLAEMRHHVDGVLRPLRCWRQAWTVSPPTGAKPVDRDAPAIQLQCTVH
jgi:signal transduction histidine kinase